MYRISAASFRKDLFRLLEKTIRYGEILHVSTQDGNAVILSEEAYNGLLASTEIMADPALYETIRDGMEIPLEDCITKPSAEW